MAAIDSARATMMTRRRFTALLGVGAAALVPAVRASAAVTRRRTPTSAQVPYPTERGWNPPQLVVNRPAAGVAPGYVFAAPTTSGAVRPGASGPLVLDAAGDPVWFLPLAKVEAQNLRVQTYLGKPVLTWYEGTPGALYGGSCVIYDPAYHEVKRVHGGHGFACDLHEFLITSRNTALLAIANEVNADLTSVGGAPDARVVEGIVQEVDIRSGKVLFEWHSLDHVPPEESFRTAITASGNVDYFHLNSIDVDSDGNLLVSARHTSTVYKLDRKNGKVLWRLGGKKSDFALGPGAPFNFQHDARRQHDGTITIFDNGATDLGAGKVESHSRGIRLRLDVAAMRATLVQAYVSDPPRLTVATGNVQQLPGGGVFVGWGTASGFTEFAADGTVRYDASFADGSSSYRVFRFPWTGTPDTRPSVALAREQSGALTARVSWNGATDVHQWELLGGPAPDKLTRLRLTAPDGFETAITTADPPAYEAVAALDAKGRVVGRTATIAPS